MSRSLHAFVSSFALLLLAGLGACAERRTGNVVCKSSSDCPGELVCVLGGGASKGLCIDPNEDHGALPQPPGGLWLPYNKDVDILFVIDNSGSMGEEQALLANSFGALIEVLEADDVRANYRIGITTSDNGNPWCPAGATTPEAGKLVLSSCRDRLDDFLFNDGAVDVRDLACTDICTLSATELAIVPTTTGVDDTPQPRPWLENIHGKKNIPAGTSTVDALRCFGPQGINGCGFESQLESMYLALTRAQTNGEAAYGFIRPNAILAVVFVTDEADCSYNKNFAEIFATDGNRVFWSDPTAPFPTSAVCWNAGVECTGDPSNYSSCDPVNKDIDGNTGVADSMAVLHPMSRYFGYLDGLENQKKEFDYRSELVVALIGGVDAEGNAYYADVGATDPEFQDSFGIGPGCTAPSNGQAVPPVRIKAVADRYGSDNMFSICADDYSAAFVAIAQKIRDQTRPACYTKCTKDTNPATPLVEPECTVQENPPGPDPSVVLQECLRDGSGAYLIDATTNDYAMPGPDVNVCYALLTDKANLTSSPADDMSPECVDRNFNLEFEFARRPGFPAAGGTTYGASCILADFPEVSCPGIGG